MPSNTFKGVVQLSKEQFNTLKTSGSLTVGEDTLVYDPNATLYVSNMWIYVPTKTSDLINDSNFATTSQIPGIVDDLNSVDNTKSLSANQGRILNEKIAGILNNVAGRVQSFTVQNITEMGNLFGLTISEQADSFAVGSNTITYDNKSYTLKNGDIFLIVDIGVPDYRFSSTDMTLYRLETNKVDLSLYAKVEVANGGFQAGRDAECTNTGAAIGYQSKTESGGAVGYNAGSTRGAAVGNSSTTEKGAAVGDTSRSINGGAVGDEAWTDNGGAVGSGANSGSGGAVGENSYANQGFSGGYNAVAGKNSKNQRIDTIQLGAGTNYKEKSLQIYDDNIYDAINHKLTVNEISDSDGGNAIQVSKIVTTDYLENNFNVDTSSKLDKVTSSGSWRTYAIDESGEQDTLPVAITETTANGGSIATYMASTSGTTAPAGRLVTNDPTNDYHAVTKKYVDSAINDIPFPAGIKLLYSGGRKTVSGGETINFNSGVDLSGVNYFLVIITYNQHLILSRYSQGTTTPYSCNYTTSNFNMDTLTIHNKTVKYTPSTTGITFDYIYYTSRSFKYDSNLKAYTTGDSGNATKAASSIQIDKIYGF